MRFLEINEICEWARERGLAVGDGFSVQVPALPSAYRATYANGTRSGNESDAAIQFVNHLGAWQACVVWIREWGVWPSGEDWPKFYAWRGARGERRSLDKA